MPEEVERVLGMYEWLFAPPGSRAARAGTPIERASALAEAIAAPGEHVLVAEHRGELLGLLHRLPRARFGSLRPRCWVEDLAVSPEHRSQGVGKALLDAAKDWAREQGATHLELDSGEARPDAHRFYEREEPTWRGYQYTRGGS